MTVTMPSTWISSPVPKAPTAIGLIGGSSQEWRAGLVGCENATASASCWPCSETELSTSHAPRKQTRMPHTRLTKDMGAGTPALLVSVLVSLIGSRSASCEHAGTRRRNSPGLCGVIDSARAGPLLTRSTPSGALSCHHRWTLPATSPFSERRTQAHTVRQGRRQQNEGEPCRGAWLATTHS
jgi:hypothetical protein